MAEADIEVREIQQRALHRLAYVEVERQKNLEAIIESASKALPDAVSANPVSRDWSRQFFDAAQDVSDTDLQELWSRILAGEIAEPGAVSRRTLEFMKCMSKVEADMFAAMMPLSPCLIANNRRFVMTEGPTLEELVTRFGSEDVLGKMTDVGILEVQLLRCQADPIMEASYFGQRFQFISVGLFSPEDQMRGFTFRRFTQIGQELSRVVQTSAQSGFLERLARYVPSRGVIIKEVSC